MKTRKNREEEIIARGFSFSMAIETIYCKILSLSLSLSPFRRLICIFRLWVVVGAIKVHVRLLFRPPTNFHGQQTTTAVGLCLMITRPDLPGLLLSFFPYFLSFLNYLFPFLMFLSPPLLPLPSLLIQQSRKSRNNPTKSILLLFPSSSFPYFSVNINPCIIGLQ